MKKFTLNVSYIFYFYFLWFLFSFNFINGAEFDITNDNIIDNLISYNKDIFSNDISEKEYSINSNQNKSINKSDNDLLKEKENKLKLNMDSFLKKYKINLFKKNELIKLKEKENDNNLVHSASEKIDKDVLKESKVRVINELDTYKDKSNILDNLQDKKKNIHEAKIKLEENKEFDYKKEILNYENKNLYLSNNTEEVKKYKDHLELKSQIQKNLKINKDNYFKVPEKSEKPTNININDNLKRINEDLKNKINEVKTSPINKSNTPMKNLNKIKSKIEKSHKEKLKKNSNYSERFLKNLFVNNYLDATVTFKINKGMNQKYYFDNIQSKVNISQDNLELIFNENKIEKQINIKNVISNFGSLQDDEFIKFSFKYNLIDKCENFILNKENISNYKSKDLNSFNNMFLNNEDHEDNIDNEENPNYTEKNFENEFYSLNNFNFYIYLNFNFEKTINKNDISKDLNRILNEGNSKEKNENEHVNERKSKNLNNDDYDKKEKDEILNVLLKFNFNHKNNNGKIFLNFFENLNNENKRKEKVDLSNMNKQNKFYSFLNLHEKNNEEFSLEDFTKEYLIALNKKNNEEEKKNFLIDIKNVDQNIQKNIEFKKDILEDPLDKDDYYIKNIEKKFEEITIKEKKFLFLKYLNNIIYNSCLEKKLEVKTAKENLRKVLEESYNLAKNITNIKNTVLNLQSKKNHVENLFKESEIVQTEKASIKDLELKQISFYKNLIEKIDKSFIRDYLFLRKDENILNEKLKTLDEEKNKFNKTQFIQTDKQTEKDNMEHEIEYHRNQIIKMQSELIDNKNILNMINNDKDLLEKKINFRTKRIIKNKNAIILLKKKIENLILEKNKTEEVIKNNQIKKIEIKENIEKDNEKLNEIDKKIKELLEEKNKIIEQVNNKTENLERLENDNLINGNKLVLINSNLIYLKSNLDEKEKYFENSNKNVEIIKNDLKKIKEKENIFNSHISNLNFSINNFTLYVNSVKRKNEILSNEINEISLNQKISNKKILDVVDQINNIQINLNKYNSNLNSNKINKKNYQINIKNTIDNLIKEKVLDENIKYYEYLENLEKNELNLDRLEDIDNIDKTVLSGLRKKYLKNKKNNYSNAFNFYYYRKNKEELFKNLIKNETYYSNSDSFSLDKIKVLKIELKKDMNSENNNNTNKSEKEINKVFLNYEIDSSKDNIENLDSKILDDYIIIDYRSLFDQINKLEIEKHSSVNMKNREEDEEVNKNAQNKNLDNISHLLKKDYFSNINEIENEINDNKSQVEKSKIKLKEIKEQFYLILSKMKEENFSNMKILLDLIELEFKQNSLNINHYNKLNKLIDILK